MASVTIVLTDRDDAVSLQTAFDPPVEATELDDPETMTLAQQVGVLSIGMIFELLGTPDADLDEPQSDPAHAA